MRAFVTGGTGFIGGYVARKLRDRGDDVVALVRSPKKAAELEALGCEPVAGDLSSRQELQRSMAGCDAVFHIAAVYKVGIPTRECDEMRDANIGGTERTLDAAVGAGVKKIVYVSTVGYFGNTRGRVVDETYVREDDGNYLSCYDETKLKAHAVAKDRIAKGAPIVIAQPGGVYGPGDQSEIGNFVRNMSTGKLRFKSFPDVGFNMGYVDDIADGIILAHDKGQVGESYVFGGEISTLGELVDKVAELSGRKPIKLTMPAWAVKASIPMAPLVTKMMGLPPNLRELIKTSDGVTYWATDAKARRDLGYSPRNLEEGLREMLAAEAA